MKSNILVSAVSFFAALLLGAGCASQDRLDSNVTDDPALSSFLQGIGAALEAHQWDRVTADADPAHYRTQVEEVGIPEPQYIAELFGLHAPGNNIESGDRPSWEDLRRIDTVRWTAVERSGDRITVHGTTTLDDGSSLRLEARVIEQDGKMRLTGGVG